MKNLFLFCFFKDAFLKNFFKRFFKGSKAQRVESKKSGYVKIKSEDPNFTLNVPYNVQILHGYE